MSATPDGEVVPSTGHPQRRTLTPQDLERVKLWLLEQSRTKAAQIRRQGLDAATNSIYLKVHERLDSKAVAGAIESTGHARALGQKVIHDKAVDIVRREIAQKRGGGKLRPLTAATDIGAVAPAPSLTEGAMPDWLRRGLDELGETEFRVLQLRLQGNTYAQIGKALNRSEGAAKVMERRVRAKLARLAPKSEGST